MARDPTLPGPAALYDLRLTTPRLELRLGDGGDLLALGLLAESGIHEPDEMPFAIAWTDAIGGADFLAGFLEHHETMLRKWTPDSWTLNLLVWKEAELVGTQTLAVDAFAARRTVETGSWLGKAYQGRGIGTEMRAAVLELAFRSLGATTARSAWLEGNDSSRRVSEKLGYRVVGEVTREPRPGQVVRAWEVAIEAADWHAPVPVKIAGAERCLPAFGPGDD